MSVMKVDPTPKQVVELQVSAVLEEFQLKEDLGSLDASEMDCAQAIHEQINKCSEIHRTPVSLADCSLPGNLVQVRLARDCIGKYSHMFNPQDVKYNQFTLMGDYANAAHHVMVIGNSTGRAYCMLHSDLFEIIPTQEM